MWSIEPGRRDTRERTRRQRLGQPRPYRSCGENGAGLYEEPRRKMTSGDANVSSDSSKTVAAAAVAPTTLQDESKLRCRRNGRALGGPRTSLTARTTCILRRWSGTRYQRLLY